MFLHALCSAFLLTAAKLYWLMENEYLNYFAGLLGPPRDRHFHAISIALGILGAIHGLQFFCHLGISVFAREMKARSLNMGSIIVDCIMRLLSRIGGWAVNHWGISHADSRSTRRRRLSNESSSAHYSHIFAFRKTVELATQVPNGYLYSTLIARSWINNAKVALLVANCWSAFSIHQMLMKSDPDNRKIVPATKSRNTAVRFTAVVVDALLSTATAIILPSAIILPYALHFDFVNLDFPDWMLYGDTAFPNLVLENRAFFFMSWANSAMKIVPHLSLLLCLEAIASMLHPSCQPDQTPITVRSLPQPRPGVNRSLIASVSYRALMRATDSVHSSAQILYRVHRVTIPILLLVTGVVVLGLHLTAHFGNVEGDVAMMEGMCLQRMYPWFASNFSCAVVKYNCYKENVLSPAGDVLSWLEREAVRKIIFLHCPAFRMPTIIREFTSLMGVEFWNTTLVEWGDQSAVSAELHPMMLFAVFVYVNMTGIPSGIMQSPLPELLTDLEFIHTNLTTVSEEVVEPWDNVQIVFIEHSQVKEFPSVLMQLPFLSELSLIDNQIESIPEDAFLEGASTYFYDLAFSKNPLQELPQARSQDFDVSYLALEFTELTKIPTWVERNVWDAVSLGGSPVCQANSTVKFTNVVRCGENENAWDPLGDERYPMALMTPFRSLDG